MFKVNQTVWCAIYGKGVVTDIREGDTYSIRVKFSDKLSALYTSEGKYHVAGIVTLFPYPVEIVKATTKPSIDWSHVSEDYKYLAMDEDGLHHLYVERPILKPSQWATNDLYINAGHFASFIPGTCDWKGSLVKRPEQGLGERPEST